MQRGAKRNPWPHKVWRFVNVLSALRFPVRLLSSVDLWQHKGSMPRKSHRDDGRNADLLARAEADLGKTAGMASSRMERAFRVQSMPNVQRRIACDGPVRSRELERLPSTSRKRVTGTLVKEGSACRREKRTACKGEPMGTLALQLPDACQRADRSKIPRKAVLIQTPKAAQARRPIDGKEQHG